jgi:hypothetical protein
MQKTKLNTALNSALHGDLPHVAKSVYEFTSLQDMAYKQAVTGDLLESMASYAKANIAGFPDSITDDGKAELFAGYRLRKAELIGVTKYAVIGNNYLPVTADSDFPEKTEFKEIGVAFAFSYTQQQFGQLKSAEPQLHAIVKTLRDDTSSYCSNRLSDLKRSAKVKTTGTKSVQAANFKDWLADTFLKIKARAKTANSRGEAINEKRLQEAIIAFNVKFNHDVE